MKSRLTIFLTVLALLLVSSSGAWATGGGQTPLAITYTATAVCNLDGTATVTLSFVVTSGNTSGGSIDWTFGSDSGTISISAGQTTDDPPGDWVAAASGPVKTFTSTVVLPSVPNGTYSGTATVSQTGGNYTDQSDTVANFVVNCTASETCDQFSEVAGQVTGNKNLAKNGTPVNFTIKGAFGDNATLTVKIANSTTVVLGPVGLVRAGDSCTYHFQWIPKDSNGNYLAAGSYQGFADGGGQPELQFSFDLTYKK